MPQVSICSMTMRFKILTILRNKLSERYESVVVVMLTLKLPKWSKWPIYNFLSKFYIFTTGVFLLDTIPHTDRQCKRMPSKNWITALSFSFFNIAFYILQRVKINRKSSCQSNMYIFFLPALQSIRNF